MNLGNGDFWGKNLRGHQSQIWDPPGSVGARRFTSSCNMSRAMNEAQCAQLRGVKSLLKDDTKRVRKGPHLGDSVPHPPTFLARGAIPSRVVAWR